LRQLQERERERERERMHQEDAHDDEVVAMYPEAWI
jgi:hypothetical protein